MITQTTLKASNQSEFQWVDVSEPDPLILKTISKEHGILESSIEDCLEPHHLPKFEKNSNYDFILIRIVDDTARESAVTVNELTRKIAIFILKDRVITIHRSPITVLKKIQDRYTKETLSAKVNPLYHLCFEIMSDGLDTFDPMIDRSISFVNSLEQERRIDLKRIYRLKAQASTLKRILRLSQDVCFKLISRLEGEEKSLFHNLKEDIDNALFFAEDLNENILHFINLQLSIQSQRTNETMRIVAIFSAFFLPLTFIAGLYGMNFKHMPELEWTFGYPFSLLLMGTSSLIIFFWVKRNKWL